MISCNTGVVVILTLDAETVLTKLPDTMYSTLEMGSDSDEGVEENNGEISKKNEAEKNMIMMNIHH